jgi:hypothetical protein
MSAIGTSQAKDTATNRQMFIRAQCEVNGMSRECRVNNLNQNGLFVESFVPAITNSKVHLSFCLPNGHKIAAPGVVINHQFKTGFKVDFIELSMKDREEINNFICS